jgi:recombinational DNA repair ATPase RecF
MMLDFVEVCGFRGFREKVRINFGRGFTVIDGRNGVGKSTVCDAVEFALTGSIDKYTVEKAAKETFRDYIWWRGEGSPPAHYVTAGFVTNDGRPFAVTRTREKGADRSEQEILAALCSTSAPQNAVLQLVKTTIIRDEWIAALSLDLTETERFELVRSALGEVEGFESTAKAKDITDEADKVHSRNEATYESVRTRLSERLVQQSEAQTALSRSGDVGAALQTIRSSVPDAPSEIQAQMAAARRALIDRRARLGQMDEALQVGRELALRRQAFDSAEAVAGRRAASAALEAAGRVRDQAAKAVAAAQEKLAGEEDADAVAASLALLVEHGEQLGLHNGHCPLCAAKRSSAEFEAGLTAARRRIATMSSSVQSVRAQLAAAQSELTQAAAEFAGAEARVAAATAEEISLRAQEQSHVEFYDGIRLGHRFIGDAAALEAEMAAERDRLIDLERALLSLDASHAVAGLSAIESSILELRSEMEKVAEIVGRSQTALASAQEIQRAVRRVGAEIIDERLAQISPLLNELYQRLRPHADWKTIDYSIRGDVRRFLSLKVGEGLNPQFVFSSGQRRAVGLAFLLSVHLARGWSPLRALILDDPVQHIDDFRALQLVEVLAAFRAGGRQIICAVEDSALADLLCRRLSGAQAEVGRRLNIDAGPQGAMVVAADVVLPPLPVGVLRRHTAVRAVGGG